MSEAFDLHDDGIDLDWDEVWVLVDRDHPSGRLRWFREWTPIGPEGTSEEYRAASFPSEQAAMQSPAFSFAMTFYKPERLAP